MSPLRMGSAQVPVVTAAELADRAAALSEATPSVGLRRAFGLSIDSRRRQRRVALDR